MHLQQGSDEWLAFRKNKIGASEAPIILGISPYMTAYQLWQEKLGLIEPQAINWAMKRGHILEPVARQIFEKLYEIEMFPQVRVCADHQWMMASLDGLNIEGTIALEIKANNIETHEKVKKGIIPEHHLAQLQHQMIVLGIESIYYMSIRSETEYHICTIEADKILQHNLVVEEMKFWNNINDLEPPALQKADYTERNDEKWNKIAKKWLKTHQRLTALSLEEKDLRKKLHTLAGTQNIKGGGITLSQVARKGSIQYGLIPQLQEMNLNLYRKEAVQSIIIRPLTK